MSDSSPPDGVASSSNWVNQSFHFSPADVNGTFLGIEYCTIVLSVVIIWHSWYMHAGRSEFYSTVRSQTETAAFAALVGAACVLISVPFPTPTKTVVMYDVIFNGLCTFIIQLMDSYMFFYRFRAVCQLSWIHRACSHGYIWIALVLPWFPAWWLAPIFIDVNSPFFSYLYMTSLYCSVLAKVVYNCYFTWEFVRALMTISNNTTMKIGDDIPAVITIKVVAYKSIGHCITSSLAMTFCFYLPYYAQIQGLVLIAGMHFWFNTVLTEDSWFYVCFGRSGRLASDFWDDFESLPDDKKDLLPTAVKGHPPAGTAPGPGLGQGGTRGDVAVHHPHHPLHFLHHAMMYLHHASPYAHRQQQHLQHLSFDEANMFALGSSPGGGVLTGLRQYKTGPGPRPGSGRRDNHNQSPGMDRNSKNSQENSRSRRIAAPPTTTQKGSSVPGLNSGKVLPFPTGVTAGGGAGAGGGGGGSVVGKSVAGTPVSRKANDLGANVAGGGGGSSGSRRPSRCKGSPGTASPPALLADFLSAISNVASMGGSKASKGSKGSGPSSRRAVSARSPSRKAADVAAGGGGSGRSVREGVGGSNKSGRVGKASIRKGGSGSGRRQGQGQTSVRLPVGQGQSPRVVGGISRSFRNTNVRTNPNNNGSGWVSRQVSGALDGHGSILSNSYTAAAQLAASVVASLTMQQSPGGGGSFIQRQSFAHRRSFVPPVSRNRSRHPSMLGGGRRSIQNSQVNPEDRMSFGYIREENEAQIVYSENDDEGLEGSALEESSSKKIRPQRHSGKGLMLEQLNAMDSEEFDLIGRIHELPAVLPGLPGGLPTLLILPEEFSPGSRPGSRPESRPESRTVSGIPKASNVTDQTTSLTLTLQPTLSLRASQKSHKGPSESKSAEGISSSNIGRDIGVEVEGNREIGMSREIAVGMEMGSTAVVDVVNDPIMTSEMDDQKNNEQIANQSNQPVHPNNPVNNQVPVSRPLPAYVDPVIGSRESSQVSKESAIRLPEVADHRVNSNLSAVSSNLSNVKEVVDMIVI